MKFKQMANGAYINIQTICMVSIDDYSAPRYERVHGKYQVMVTQAIDGCPRYIYKKVDTREEAEQITRTLIMELEAGR